MPLTVARSSVEALRAKHHQTANSKMEELGRLPFVHHEPGMDTPASISFLDWLIDASPEFLALLKALAYIKNRGGVYLRTRSLFNLAQRQNEREGEGMESTHTPKK